MDDSFDYDKVDTVINRIVENINPNMIVVFGSVARREAKKNSDLDLLVVFDQLDDEDKMFIRISKLFIGLKLSYDLVIMTRDELEHYSRFEQSFEHEIMSTGKVVYAQ